MYMYASAQVMDILTYIRTYLNSTLWTVLIPLTHPPSPPFSPQLLIDADILPTLLLLLDHSNSAVQTNTAWALMVRRGEGRGRRERKRKRGEGRVPRASYLC